MITSSWFFFTPIVIIKSVTPNKKRLAIAFANIVTHSSLYQEVGTIIVHTCANHIIKHMIPHTPSQVSVLQSITYANISDEGRLYFMMKNLYFIGKTLCSFMKFILFCRNWLQWYKLHRVRNLNKYMMSFLLVSNICDQCYTCKVPFADTQKCDDHWDIFSSLYNWMFYSIYINCG